MEKKSKICLNNFRNLKKKKNRRKLMKKLKRKFKI